MAGSIINLLEEVLLVDLSQLLVLREQLVVLLERSEILGSDLRPQTVRIGG